MARSAPAHCGTCGFLLPLAGAAARGVRGLRQRVRARRRRGGGGRVRLRRPLGRRVRAGVPGRGRRAGLRRRGRAGAGRRRERERPTRSAPPRCGPAVLAAWADSPTRFREDANAEEDLRLGGYADTWCVELAQNAADAARAAGVAGTGADRGSAPIDGRGELRVANTGAPLDAAGVAALAALRASAKRDDAGSVGRFGVGFAAVLALSDAPRIVTAGGGVAFSAASTAEAVRELPGPAAELARRDGQLPVLRLVWPTGADEPPPPAGYATEVRLPLRPGVDADALLGQPRRPPLRTCCSRCPTWSRSTSTAGGSERRRCRGSETHGDRRDRRAGRIAALARWSAAPRRVARRHRRRAARPARAGRSAGPCRSTPTADPAPLGDDVLHAPDRHRRTARPARPADRRRSRWTPTAAASAPAPATDAVLRAAADAYLDLVAAVAPDERLALVPAAGFPRSELDARLRALLLDALRAAAVAARRGRRRARAAAAPVLDLPAARTARAARRRRPRPARGTGRERAAALDRRTRRRAG